MGKYEDLQRIQNLKDSGSMTEKEFEIEKYKILNSNESDSNNNNNDLSSLLLGLFGFLFGAVPILGLILNIIALKFCKKQLKENNNGMIIAGYVLSILGLILAIIITFLLFISLLIYIYNSSSAI